MPETFSTRQLAVIAAANKTVYWLFRVIDNLGTEYHWSTGTVPAGTGTINVGAVEAPGGYSDSEWDTSHTFKITNFSGITLRRSKSESGIHAPNDVNFTILNSSNTLTASNFKNGQVRIALVVDDGLGKQVVGSWRFRIKSASPYNQQIDVVCEDFLQQYLQGTYPNTRLVSDIFPTANDTSNDSICVPEPYGTCYVPLRSIYTGTSRYYLLGDTTDTYTISEVRSPASMGTKIAWTSPSYTFTQSTKPDADLTNWRVFQPIIVDSNSDGVVDASGIWVSGTTILDMPTKFSKALTLSVTNPADIIRIVLRNMGCLDYDLNLASFDTAKTTFASWGLTWNFAFWYKENRTTVLSKLLAMCHACLVVGEQLSLQVLSKVSQKTITSVEVTKSQETGPSSFKYTDAIAEVNSDSAYVAWQQSGESQDTFLKTLVPAKTTKLVVGSETIEFPGVQNTQHIQKLGTLYYQRKLLKEADVSCTLKGTCLALRPDDVITINYADFGGSYDVLIDEVVISADVSINIRAIKFSVALDDWADLNPGAITISTDTTTGTYSVIISGPDSTNASVPNALEGRLRIGKTTSFILLDPDTPEITLYDAGVEKVKLGELDTNVYGLRGKDATGKTIFELRTDEDPFIDTYANDKALELELMKMNFQIIAWAQFAIYDAFNDETKRADPEPAVYQCTVEKSYLISGGIVADRAYGFTSKTYTNITTIETGTSTSVGLNFLTDTGKSWFADQCTNLTLVDSAASTFTITSNTPNTLTVSGTPAAGAYSLKDDNPTSFVAFLSYLDYSNGGYGYIRMEVSFDNGGHYQIVYDSSDGTDYLEGTMTCTFPGTSYIARLTLTNDSSGRQPIVYKFLVCTDPSPWRY